MTRREALLNACGLLALLATGLLGAGGAAAAPGGMRLGLPPAPGAVLVALVVALVWKLGCNAAACAPLLALPALLVSGVPLPGLLALSGPPLLSIFAAGVALLLSDRSPRWASRALVPTVVVLYLCVAARVQWRVGPEGDEPHYLMVAESLLRDHDLDLAHDYAEGRYRSFHPAPLEPHYRVRGAHGEIYSLHAVGLSLLLLPAYATFGYPGASFFMALLAALLVREVRELVRAVSGREALATGVAWVVALSPPLIHYAGLIFTEVPAALCLAFALRKAREGKRGSPAAAFGWGAALALLPWLNVRYALFPVIVLAYAATHRPRWRSLLLAAAPLGLSAIAIAIFHHALYGFFDPRLVYGRRPEFALATMSNGLPGLLLDQEFGLLVYAPLFALAVPGLVRLWRSAWRDAAAMTVLTLVVVLTASTWDMWRGGFNPPARFLVPILPALVVAVAAALADGLGAPTALLVGWGLWTGLAGAADPSLVHRDRDGTAPFFRVHSGAEEWTRLLPSYVLAGEDRHRLALVWLIALTSAVAARSARPTRRAVAISTLGLMAAAACASRLSHGLTEGRDAARVVGRPALRVPGWRITTTARWGAEVLGWGPLFEPHRHPDGATIAGRVRLAAGEYTLGIERDPELPAALAPELEIRPEARGATPRRVALAPSSDGWRAEFEVRPDEETGIRLLLRGGGPFLLRAVTLDHSTLRSSAGLIQVQGGATVMEIGGQVVEEDQLQATLTGS